MAGSGRYCMVEIWRCGEDEMIEERTKAGEVQRMKP